MLNIVIPMAGAGSRFAQAGYPDPKPLIPVHGVPMIKLVIDNLTPKISHRFIFVAQRAHVEAYDLTERLEQWAPGSVTVQIDGLTEGAAVTVLKAREYIDNDDALMIANSDQWVDVDIDAYLASLGDADGLIMTMRDDNAKWSYLDFDERGEIVRVVEKEVVSEFATVGIYNFAHGRDFVAAAETMIAEDARVNGEFYVAPVYDYCIRNGARVVHHDLGEVSTVMFGLGIPQDLEYFLTLPQSHRAASVTA